jgi:hypothetical protein
MGDMSGRSGKGASKSMGPILPPLSPSSSILSIFFGVVNPLNAFVKVDTVEVKLENPGTYVLRALAIFCSIEADGEDCRKGEGGTR